jgi:hypothetical protein
MTEHPQKCTSSVRLCSECERPHEARGLCALHYQRLRRTGDPRMVRKSGPDRSHLRKTFEDLGVTEQWSPRTSARFLAACRLIFDLGGHAIAVDALEKASRPNGTVNVSKLERLAHKFLFACERRYEMDKA